MTTTLDVTKDYLNWDNTEAVTVSLIRTTGTTARTIANALRRAINRTDSQVAGVQIGAESTAWNIAVDQMTTGDEIKEGDTVTDADSVVWTVKIVALLTFKTRWRVVCTKNRT